MTVNEAIKKALQELGIIGFNGTATNAQAQDMLSIMNGMMAEWEVDDIDVGWFPQDTLSETLPVPQWMEQGFISNLAVIAASTFRAPVSAELAVKAADSKNTILSTVLNLNLDRANMKHLHQGENGRWDIETDQ